MDDDGGVKSHAHHVGPQAALPLLWRREDLARQQDKDGPEPDHDFGRRSEQTEDVTRCHADLFLKDPLGLETQRV